MPMLKDVYAKAAALTRLSLMSSRLSHWAKLL